MRPDTSPGAPTLLCNFFKRGTVNPLNPRDAAACIKLFFTKPMPSVIAPLLLVPVIGWPGEKRRTSHTLYWLGCSTKSKPKAR